VCGCGVYGMCGVCVYCGMCVVCVDVSLFLGVCVSLCMYMS